MLMHPLIILCLILLGISFVLNFWGRYYSKENVEKNWKTKASSILGWTGLIIVVLYFILDFFEVLY